MSNQLVPVTVAYGDGIGPPTVAHAQIASLLARLAAAGLAFIKTEHLCSFDGQKAFSGAD